MYIYDVYLLCILIMYIYYVYVSCTNCFCKCTIWIDWATEGTKKYTFVMYIYDVYLLCILIMQEWLL